MTPTQSISASRTTELQVSVIVPTYHDWPRLGLCIEALRKQTLPVESVEVIIVNNDPKDLPPDGLSLPANFLMIAEEAPGSYAARNAALRIARGAIVAFTDSDCIPEPDWLEKGVAYLRQGHDRVAGHVSLFYAGKRLTWAEMYEKAFAFNQAANVASGGAVTANLLSYRHMFDDVGPFDSSLMSGGDMEWNRRASAKGKTLVYGRDSIVNHPARATMKQLAGKLKRVTGGAVKPGKISVTELCKAVMPPLVSLPVIIRNRNLNAMEKLKVFLVCYYLKIYRLYVVYRLKSGAEKPARQ